MGRTARFCVMMWRTSGEKRLMSWRPIDLAPRDGSRIVVAFRSPLSGQVSVFVTRWTQEGWVHDLASGEVAVNGDVAFAWTALPKTDV